MSLALRSRCLSTNALVAQNSQALSSLTTSFAPRPARKRPLNLSLEADLSKRRKVGTVSIAGSGTVMLIDCRVTAFVLLCKQHQEFLTTSKLIDRYCIAMAFVYLQRSNLPAFGYTQDLLFYALCLALQTEDDDIDSADEVVDYVCGTCPHSPYMDGEANREEYDEWKYRVSRHKAKLKAFEQGKAELWKKIGFRTLVTRERCLYELSRFPAEGVFVKERHMPPNQFEYISPIKPPCPPTKSTAKANGHDQRRGIKAPMLC